MSAHDRTLFAGVDIGGTTTQVVLCDEDLTVLDRAEVATPAADGGQAMIGAALGALAPLLERTPGRLAGGGVGAAGLVDSATGRILVAGRGADSVPRPASSPGGGGLKCRTRSVLRSLRIGRRG